MGPESGDGGAGGGSPPAGTEAAPPRPTIHEAELVPGPSGAVQYGSEIDEPAAVARRVSGGDIVVRGDDTTRNRSLVRAIESRVGPPSRPQFPHTTTGGRGALPHFHQASRSPSGHAFYETDRRKARRRP